MYDMHDEQLLLLLYVECICDILIDKMNRLINVQYDRLMCDEQTKHLINLRPKDS